MDTIHAAVARSPGRVVDAIAALSDHEADLRDHLLMCPLGTEEGVRTAAKLQGRILGVQDVVQIFIGKILEEENEGAE